MWYSCVKMFELKNRKNTKFFTFWAAVRYRTPPESPSNLEGPFGTFWDVDFFKIFILHARIHSVGLGEEIKVRERHITSPQIHYEPPPKWGEKCVSWRILFSKLQRKTRYWYGSTNGSRGHHLVNPKNIENFPFNFHSKFWKFWKNSTKKIRFFQKKSTSQKVPKGASRFGGLSGGVR